MVVLDYFLCVRRNDNEDNGDDGYPPTDCLVLAWFRVVGGSSEKQKDAERKSNWKALSQYFFIYLFIYFSILLSGGERRETIRRAI